MIKRVAPENVDKAWIFLGPALNRALEKANGERTLDDVRNECKSGLSQLWFAGETALVTEIVTYPQQKVARMVLCGGNMFDVMENIRFVKDWARSEGCKALEICGRRGWVKALGFDETYTVSRAEL